MTVGDPDIVAPSTLQIFADGRLDGASRTYEKSLADMGGVYADDSAWRAALVSQSGESLVYSVADQRYSEAEGALIVGTSTLLPGRYGDEYAVTRGHLHAIADRAELYYCLSGRGVLLLETIHGAVEAVELNPGTAVNVPGGWVHRSVNVGGSPFVTMFCYAADAGQDYQIIEDAGGMATLVVDDGHGGWSTRPNPRHTGYREMR